jgi:hypothetical protein
VNRYSVPPGKLVALRTADVRAHFARQHLCSTLRRFDTYCKWKVPPTSRMFGWLAYIVPDVGKAEEQNPPSSCTKRYEGYCSMRTLRQAARALPRNVSSRSGRRLPLETTMLQMCTDSSLGQLPARTAPCCYVREMPGASESTIMRLLLQKCDNELNCFVGDIAVPATRGASPRANSVPAGDRPARSNEAAAETNAKTSTETNTETNAETSANAQRQVQAGPSTRDHWLHIGCLVHPQP